MKRETKEKLTNNYMVNYPEITPFQKEWCRKHTAKWIMVSKDSEGNYHSHCTCCNKDIELRKTKHHSIATCPECGKQLEVIHDWRIQSFEDYSFVGIPKAISKNELLLRYVFIERNKDNINAPHIAEVARLVMTEKSSHTFELEDGEWKYKKWDWFRETNMGRDRKKCCLMAYAYKPMLARELRKLDYFKYLSPEMIGKLINDRYYLDYSINTISRHNVFYENLFKIGLSDLAVEDFGNRVGTYYGYSGIDYNKAETRVEKMLDITKEQLLLLKRHQTILSLKAIHKINNANDATLSLINGMKVSSYDIDAIAKLKHINKTLRYMINNEIKVTEYTHYLWLLENNNYPLNNANLYPKNFRDFEAKVVAENKMRLDKEAREKRMNNNKLIGEIANGLRENDELKTFFAGSDGLIVFVPESVEELIAEGKRLNNCLSSYGDRVAQGKTLIFFIRQIDNPDAPYVAMEYCHGRVMQCMLNYNKPAEGKILDFAEALANRLNKLNILAA